MSTLPPTASTRIETHAAPEVVAGLVNDGSAAHVARAAVDEAVTRRCAIRFVQVLAPGLDAAAREDAGAVTFQTALVAMRGHSRLRCTFELLTGDPKQVLVQCSGRAAVLVVGADRAAPGAAVAAHCRAHATCEVRTVPVGV